MMSCESRSSIFRILFFSASGITILYHFITYSINIFHPRPLDFTREATSPAYEHGIIIRLYLSIYYSRLMNNYKSTTKT